MNACSETDNWHPDSIVRLLLDAGRIAMDHYDQQRWELKPDNSLVTEADTAIEQSLCNALESTTLNRFVIGEETVDTKGETYIQHALRGTTYVVDPIDGTAAFAHHLPTWGISIGLMEQSVLTEGAIYMPALQELYISSQGKNYVCHVKSPEVSPESLDLQRLETDHHPFSNGSMLALGQTLTKGPRIDVPNPVQATCCAVFALMKLMTGSYSGYIGDMKLWDLAGALPMLINTGLTLNLASSTGQPIPFTQQVSTSTIRLADDDPKRWYLTGTLMGGTESAVVHLNTLIAAGNIQLR